MPDRLLVIQVAALGRDALDAHWNRTAFRGCEIRAARSTFPAVTCTAQASFRTASPASSHGMVFNGTYSRALRKPSFWEQSSRLVEGERFWSGFRARGGTVGMAFWQQSLGEEVDAVLSPAPIHTHGGGMIDALYSKPSDLSDRLTRAVGRRFALRGYWGPLASRASSAWITDAIAAWLGMPDARPDLLLAYLPHLDYALQRRGPRGRAARSAFRELEAMLATLHDAAARAGYDVLVVGDYAIGEARGVALPNRLLADAGLLRTRRIGRRLYPDFHESAAFAVVDHEVAHVYVQRAGDVGDVAEALADSRGRWEVLDRAAMAAHEVDHDAAGELLLVARQGWWFAYPWWRDRRDAPDYASHVDIHNKPGFDPCELFFGWPPPGVSQRPHRIRGTHGVAGPGREVAWWCTWNPGGERPLATTVEVAGAVKESLEPS